jgi:hypothetical protein
MEATTFWRKVAKSGTIRWPHISTWACKDDRDNVDMHLSLDVPVEEEEN